MFDFEVFGFMIGLSMVSFGYVRSNFLEENFYRGDLLVSEFSFWGVIE